MKYSDNIIIESVLNNRSELSYYIGSIDYIIVVGISMVSMISSVVVERDYIINIYNTDGIGIRDFITSVKEVGEYIINRRNLLIDGIM